jgi:hypothetical protein
MRLTLLFALLFQLRIGLKLIELSLQSHITDVLYTYTRSLKRESNVEEVVECKFEIHDSFACLRDGNSSSA